MTSPGTPAQWLIAEYEATDPEEFTREETAEAVPGPSRSVYVQPIFTLKSTDEAGNPMRVHLNDYFDQGRWWL
jgi:hypothetical protein